jgi:hypothetical protein
MSFEKDYNKIYNLTVGTIQHMYSNITRNMVDIDFKFNLFLNENLLNYEPYLFECCIFLTKYLIYYIFFLMLFESVSIMFESVSLYSSVTRKYIHKYNESLQQINILNDEHDIKIYDLYNNIYNLNLENQKLHNKVQTKDQSTQLSSNTYQLHKLSHSLSDPSLSSKHVRQSAKESTRTIKELVRQKLI